MAERKLTVSVSTECYQGEHEAVCCLSVPNRLLLEWAEEVSAATHDDEGPVYIQLLNSAIDNSIVGVDLSCERLERRLAMQARKMLNNPSRLRGGARARQLEKASTFHVRRGETVAAVQVIEELNEVTEEGEAWRERYYDSEAAVLRLTEELRELVGQEQERDQVHHGGDFSNTGKLFDDLSSRQQRRKLTQLKSSAEKALWFIDSFGLDVKSIALETRHGNKLDISLHDTSTSSSSINDSSVRQALYLLERFGVSDEFYHELSMVNTSLPRSHLVKKARHVLTESVEILRLSQPYCGAYRPFESTLKATLSYELRTATLTNDTVVTVKLSGDGAHLSRTTQMQIISFSLPGVSKDALSSYGNHTIAAVKAGEDYEVLRLSLDPVWKEINSMIGAGRVEVDGKDVRLRFVLGSDYKFLLLLMGLNAAHANYACLWCRIHKDQRWDMSIQSANLSLRSLSDIKKCAASDKPAEKFGCLNSPLLNLPLDDIIVDELHLLLRVSDKLIDNLVVRAEELDHKAQLHGSGSPHHISMLEKAIASCGVHFKIWKSKTESSGRHRHKYEWTPLNGQGRLKVLGRLNWSDVDELVEGEAGDGVKKLWEDFLEIYGIISNWNPSTETTQNLQEKCKQWVKLYVSLGEHYEGYSRKHVTPYMHIMVFHVPDMIERYGNIKMFSGQGVEKNNDEAKKHIFSSNMHDVPGEILKADARLEMLQRGTSELPTCTRTKRPYTKKNIEYWDAGIQEMRSRSSQC